MSLVSYTNIHAKLCTGHMYTPQWSLTITAEPRNPYHLGMWVSFICKSWLSFTFVGKLKCTNTLAVQAKCSMYNCAEYTTLDHDNWLSHWLVPGVYDKVSCTRSAALAVALGPKRPCQMTTCLFRFMEFFWWRLHKAFLRMRLLLSNTWLQVCTLKQCPTIGVVFLRQLSKVALLHTLPVIPGAQWYL